MASRLMVGLFLMGLLTSFPHSPESKAPKDDEGFRPKGHSLINHWTT